jgi:hypothetical protein
MGKFVLLFTGGGMPESEEERAEVLAAWGAWFEGLGEDLVDPGNPFSPAVQNIASNGAVSDGPFGTLATGYIALKADSMEAAVGMAKTCPMLEGNGQITIYEALDM